MVMFPQYFIQQRSLLIFRQNCSETIKDLKGSQRDGSVSTGCGDLQPYDKNKTKKTKKVHALRWSGKVKRTYKRRTLTQTPIQNRGKKERKRMTDIPISHFSLRVKELTPLCIVVD